MAALQKPILHGWRGCPAGNPMVGGNIGMNLLVVTNLYPPQELGGYGRSIADFVWGLQELGHSIQVLSSDAPYLGASSGVRPKQGRSGPATATQRAVMRVAFGICRTHSSAEPLIKPMPRSSEPGLTADIGMESCWAISTCLAPNCYLRFWRRHASCSITWVLCMLPFPQCLANSDRYRLVAASEAVRSALVKAGLPTSDSERGVPRGAKRTVRHRIGWAMPTPR